MSHEVRFWSDLIATVTGDDASAMLLDDLLSEGISDDIASKTVPALNPEDVLLAEILDCGGEAVTLERIN